MQLSALTLALGRFVSELQRRKVIRVAAGYVVGAWIVLQVALALQTAMTLSASFSAAILALLVIGFPIALGLSWFFEITPDGVKRTVAAGDGALLKPRTPDFILAAMLALVLVVAVVQAVLPRESTQVSPTATARTDKPKVEPPALGDKSVAVLPFVNLSPDKGDAYFADGLTEEILNALAQIRGAKVISRTSSYAFVGKNIPLPEIAKALGVRFILEGSVRHAGDDVRITAQLVDVPSDTHVWSKTFEPKLEHVFAVQDDIAQAIAVALEVEIQVPVDSRGAPTQNMEAYRLWLQGLAAARSGNMEAPYELFEFSKRAVALDPRFAEALATLATGYTARAFYNPAHRPGALRLAKEAAATAIELKPNAARVRAALGSIALLELRWADAVRESAEVLKLDPSISTAWLTLASTLWRAGKFAEASRILNEGRRLDPLNRNYVVTALLFAFDRGDDSTVEAIARRMTQRSKDIAGIGHYYLAVVARDKGDREAALREFNAAMMARGSNADIVKPIGAALGSKMSVVTAIEALRAEAAKDPTFDIAEYLALIDSRNAWLDELDARIAAGDTLSAAWRIGGVWRLVAQGKGDNPRIKTLMRNAHLVDYWKKHGWPDRCRPKGDDDFECS